MRIALFFDNFRADTVGIYFERALKNLGHDVVRQEPKDSEKIVGDFDLYWRVDDGFYTENIPERLKPSVYWVSDTHLKKPFQAICRLSRNYDLIFAAQETGFKRLRAKRFPVVWAHSYGCDEQLHKRLNLKKLYDIGFVGTDGGNPRKFYLQALRERYPNSFIATEAHTEISRIYSQSRIGVHYAISDDTFSMRSFEIMACGAMLLLNAPADKNRDLLGFASGEHLVLYHSPDELFRLTDYYLKHQDERERIAEAGHAMTLSRHTYKHRVQFMLEEIRQRLGKRYPHLDNLKDASVLT